MGTISYKEQENQDDSSRPPDGQMSDKKKKLEDLENPWDLPKKQWVGSIYDEYAPNGYSLEDEYGWTSQDKDEMYAEAVRDLKAILGAKKEQRKKEEETEEKK